MLGAVPPSPHRWRGVASWGNYRDGEASLGWLVANTGKVRGDNPGPPRCRDTESSASASLRRMKLGQAHQGPCPAA